jgi:hypothetical protein
VERVLEGPFSQRISRRNQLEFVPQTLHGNETDEMLNLRIVTDDDDYNDDVVVEI